MFEEVLRNAQAAQGEDPRLPTYRQNLGRSLMLNGRLDAALPLLQAPIEGSSDARDLAEWMRRSGRLTRRSPTPTKPRARSTRCIPPPDHPRHGQVARVRGLILRDRHRFAEAGEACAAPSASSPRASARTRT